MLRVITYHRVAEPVETSWLNPCLISATPAAFAQQMRHVVKHYEVVSVIEVLNAIDKRELLPRRAVLITFDDAYQDFGQIAWPILKQFRVPVTLFVPTAYPGRPERAFWWDRLFRVFLGSTQTELAGTPLGRLSLRTRDERRASVSKIQGYLKTIRHAEAMALVDWICTQLGEVREVRASVLSWPALRRLAQEGVTLAAHTRTHPLLTQIPNEEAREEICSSQLDLQREIGRVLPVFSYPDGANNDRIVSLLREEGFRLAFTALDGQNGLDRSRLLRLHRTNITPRTSLGIFRLRLTPLGAYLDRLRHTRHFPVSAD